MENCNNFTYTASHHLINYCLDKCIETIDDDNNYDDYNKGARGAEALVAGFIKSRAQNIIKSKGARGAEALVAGFRKSRAQNIIKSKGARGAEAFAMKLS